MVRLEPLKTAERRHAAEGTAESYHALQIARARAGEQADRLHLAGGPWKRDQRILAAACGLAHYHFGPKQKDYEERIAVLLEVGLRVAGFYDLEPGGLRGEGSPFFRQVYADCEDAARQAFEPIQGLWLVPFERLDLVTCRGCLRTRKARGLDPEPKVVHSVDIGQWVSDCGVYPHDDQIAACPDKVTCRRCLSCSPRSTRPWTP